MGKCNQWITAANISMKIYMNWILYSIGSLSVSKRGATEHRIGAKRIFSDCCQIFGKCSKEVVEVLGTVDDCELIDIDGEGTGLEAVNNWGSKLLLVAPPEAPFEDWKKRSLV